MTFPFNFYLAAFAGAFLTTLLALPLWRKWCLRTNLLDDSRDRKNYDAPKIHSGAIPLAGGFAVLTGILLPLMIGASFVKFGIVKISFTNLIAHGLERRGLELATIVFGAIAVTFLGWFDDKYELKPLPKFAGQFLIALLVAFACKRITLFVPSVAFSYIITILWLLTIINAFNFMDNMNGLCAGLGAIGALIFALIAAASGEYLVAINRISHVRRAHRVSALQFSECPRLSRGCRQPSCRLPPCSDGDSSTFLHETKSKQTCRAFAAACAGNSAD